MAFETNFTAGTPILQQVSSMVGFSELSTVYEDNPLAVWAAIGATAAMVPLSSLLFAQSKRAPAPFLDSQKWQAIALVEATKETHNVWRLTFALPHKQQLLGVPAGQHIKVRVASAKGSPIEEAFCTKESTIEQAFSPISTDDTPGEVALLVKEYAEGHPEAAMNAALLGLQPGESVQIKGPFGSFKYQPGKYKAIALLAGGTGITPMVNLSHAILKNNDDKVKLRLIYANDSPADVLLKQQLDAMAAGYYGKFKAFYVVNQAPEEGHHYSLGLIDKEMVSKYFNTPPGDDVLTVVCGPPAFRADMAGVLSSLHYENTVVIDDM